MHRRSFIKMSLAFGLGILSGGFGIYTSLKKSKKPCYLPEEPDKVISCFGKGFDIIKHLEASVNKKRLAERIDNLITSNKNTKEKFSKILSSRVANDFKENRIVNVNGWVLSETEVGIFLLYFY